MSPLRCARRTDFIHEPVYGRWIEARVSPFCSNERARQSVLDRLFSGTKCGPDGLFFDEGIRVPQAPKGERPPAGAPTGNSAEDAGADAPAEHNQ